MTCTCRYSSPLGEILLAADETGLTGLWFMGAKYFAATLDPHAAEGDTPVLAAARRWLDVYFRGEQPDFTPPLHPAGSAFRWAVWDILLQIPYGETTTYGAIAKQLAAQQEAMQQQAMQQAMLQQTAMQAQSPAPAAEPGAVQ